MIIARTEDTETIAVSPTEHRQTVSRFLNYYNHDGRGDGVVGWRRSDVKWANLRSEFGPFSAIAPTFADQSFTFCNLHSDGLVHYNAAMATAAICSPVDYVVEGSRVVYPDAFGIGSDLILELRSSGVARLVRVRAGFAPQPSYRFQFTTDRPTKIIRLTQSPYEVDSRGPKVVDTNSVTMLDNGNASTYLRPFIGWDGEKSGVIIATLEKTAGGFDLIKQVPSWWDGATDLYIDDTSVVSPSTDEGSVYNIDAGADSNTNWDTCRNALTGDGIDASGVGFINVCAYYRTAGTPGFRFQRGFTDFTPSLAAGDTVTAVALDFYESLSLPIADDIVFVPSAHALPPTTADYDSLSYTDYGRRAFTASEATGYKTWSLNATGLAAFNKSSINKYGIIVGDDCDNTYPCSTSTVASAWQFHSQDNASNKPYMTITYTPTATGYKNLLLMGVG